MGKITELAEQKKIKVLKNLMTEDRIEITYEKIIKPSEYTHIVASGCFYFLRWDVIKKEIMTCNTKYDIRRYNDIPLSIPLDRIIEIKKLIPTR